MSIRYKIITKNPGDDRLAIRRAISHLQTSCGSAGSYQIGESADNMGWAFFNLDIDDSFENAVVAKLSDMIQKYKGDNNQKFDSFIADYVSSKGCTVSIKRIG